MSTPLGLQNSEEGADQPVVLRTSMIPDEILSKAFIWHAEPFLHYTLPGSLGLLKTEVSKRLFTEVLAPRLLSDRVFVTGVHDEDSTMFRTWKRLTALSLGTQRMQFEQRMMLVWPRPCLERPLLRRLDGMAFVEI